MTAPAVGLSTGRILATVLLPFALAHFISYLFRSVNAVVYPDLVRDVGLTANTLGLLTGTYFIAFAAAQLPVGVALDRFGPRKVQIPMLLIAATGAVLFAQAQSVGGLILARGLIGLGVAASLMSAIKASSLWLPPARLPFVTSVLLAVGGLGAVVSTSPLQWVLDHASWRQAFVGMGVATVLLVGVIVAVVPEHPQRHHPVSLAESVRSIGELYRSSSFWKLALCTLFTNAGYMAVQGLWIGPWLRDVGQLQRSDVAQVLLIASVAMVAGSLGFGWLTDALRGRRVQPLLVCGAGMGTFLLIETLMVLGNGAAPTAMAIGFSFFGTAAALNYAIIAQSVSPALTGRVSTCFNLLIFIAAFAMQWGLGAIINAWPSVDGHYPVQAYRVALGTCLALQVPGLLLWASFKPWRTATR